VQSPGSLAIARVHPALAADGVSCKTIFDCTAPYPDERTFRRAEFMAVDLAKYYNRGMRYGPGGLRPRGVFGGRLRRGAGVALLLLRALQQSKGALGIVLPTIRFPSFLWSLAAALAVALRTPRFPASTSREPACGWERFIIISLTLVASLVAVRMWSEYGLRQGMPLAGAGLARALIRVLVLALARCGCSGISPGDRAAAGRLGRGRHCGSPWHCRTRSRISSRDTHPDRAADFRGRRESGWRAGRRAW